MIEWQHQLSPALLLVYTTDTKEFWVSNDAHSGNQKSSK